MRRVIVCGGRYFKDKERLVHALNSVHYANPITELFHGGARGADMMAGEWANDRDIRVRIFPADWNRYKKAAGSIRNRLMLAAALKDEGIYAVYYFPGGDGTADMVEIAKKAGVKVIPL